MLYFKVEKKVEIHTMVPGNIHFDGTRRYKCSLVIRSTVRLLLVCRRNASNFDAGFVGHEEGLMNGGVRRRGRGRGVL